MESMRGPRHKNIGARIGTGTIGSAGVPVRPVLLRRAIPPEDLDRPLDPSERLGVPARVGVVALHELPVPALDLLPRGPPAAEPRRVDLDPAEPKDPERRVDPLRL